MFSHVIIINFHLNFCLAHFVLFLCFLFGFKFKHFFVIVYLSLHVPWIYLFIVIFIHVISMAWNPSCKMNFHTLKNVLPNINSYVKGHWTKYGWVGIMHWCQRFDYKCYVNVGWANNCIWIQKKISCKIELSNSWKWVIDYCPFLQILEKLFILKLFKTKMDHESLKYFTT
jgi:hypothetical protein